MLSLPKKSLCNVKYKFYATLLDAFQWYLKSDNDDAFQEFIDKLNRVPFTNEAVEKGTGFNELVDKIKNRDLIPVDTTSHPLVLPVKETETIQVNAKGLMTYGLFDYKWSVVEKFIEIFKWADDQVYVEGILPTRKGDVLLYGYVDEVVPGGWMSDIKATKSYEFPKFLHNWQHIVYPYILNSHGIRADEFSYEITDYNYHYKEDYIFDVIRDTRRLVAICSQLIDFIELHRDLITDKKVFALDGEKRFLLLNDAMSMIKHSHVYGRRGDQVALIAVHGDVYIVEGQNGERFSINRSQLIEYESIVSSGEQSAAGINSVSPPAAGTVRPKKRYNGNRGHISDSGHEQPTLL